MRHRQVRDVMAADPMTVTPVTPLKDVADILASHKVSAVPVLSIDGTLLGVVAGTDLAAKEQLRHDPDAPRWTQMSYRTRRAVATAETAGDLMRTHPVTVRADATVAEAARLMDRHQASCLPVADERGKLLGIVGSRDLLRVL